MKRLHIQPDLRIALLYAFFGGLWILLSDKLLALIVKDAPTITAISIYKGWLYVAVSAILIYVLLHRELQTRGIVQNGLSKSEETYRYLFANHPHPMWIYDLETLTFLEVNDAAIAKYGYSRAEFLGMTIKDIRPPEELLHLAENLAQQRMKLEYSEGWKHRLKDGTHIDVSITSHTIQFNGCNAALVVAEDITERKQAEQELINSEKRFRALIENGADYISLVTVDGNLLWESPADIHMLGYADNEFLGRNMLELVHPQDLNWVQERFARLASTPGGQDRASFRLRRQDGSYRWVEATVTNLLDEASVQAIVINYYDITERKQAEDAMRESEQRYRTTLNDMMEGCQIIDYDWRYIYVNDTVARQGHKTPDELLMHTMMEIYPGIENTELFSAMAHCMEGRRPERMENKFIYPDGTFGWYELSIQPVPEGIFILSIDITERKQAEQNYQNIFENAVEGIFQSTPQGKLLSINPAAAHIYGYASPQEMIESVNDLARQVYVNPQDRELFIEQMQTKGEVKDLEELNYRKDGNIIWASKTARIVRDSKGQTLYYEGFVQDITERKQVEEKLEESERFNRSTLNALTSNIAVLDETGNIIAVNRPWLDFAQANGGDPERTAIGMNYLAVCDAASAPDHEKAAEMAAGIRAVMSAEADSFMLEYPCHSPADQRWFQARVTRFEDGGPLRIVVGHMNITERKRAETERQALLEIMLAAARTPNLPEFLERTYQSLNRVISAENFFVVFHDPVSSLFEEIFAVDKFDSPMPSSRLEKSITSYVFRTGEPLLLSQAKFEEMIAEGEVELIGTKPASWLGAPLKTPSQTIGVIAVQNYEDTDCYSERDREFIASVGAQVAMVIERRQAENQLRESEERYRNLVENMNDVVMEVDANGNFCYISPNYATLAGYPVEDELGTPAFTHVHPDDLPMLLEKLQEILTSEQQHLTYRIQIKSGEWRWIETTGKPYHMTDGSLRLIVVARDITERKQAETAIHESEERFRSLIEQSVDGIVLIDEQGIIVEWNKAEENITGIPQSRALGTPLWDIQYQILLPEHRTRSNPEYFKKGFFESFQNGTGGQLGKPMDVEIASIDGEHKSIQQTSFLIKSEKGNRIGSIVRDVTSLKYAQKELKESEDRYRSLFEDSPVSLWVEDFSEVKKFLDALKQEGVKDFRAYFSARPEAVLKCASLVKVTDVNKATVKLFNAQSKADLLKPLVELLHDEPIAQFQNELVYIAEGQRNFDWDAINKTVDGKPLNVTGNWSAAPGYEDSLGKVILAMLDVTARKKAERQVQTQLQRLQAFHIVDQSITSNFDQHIVLDTVLKQLTAQLHMDAICVSLFDKYMLSLECVASIGFYSSARQGTTWRLEQSLAGQAIRERRLIHIPDLSQAGNDFPNVTRFTDEKFISYYAIPLISKGEIKGVIELFHRSWFEADTDWLEFLDAMSVQTAIAIDNFKLFDELQKSNMELVLAYNDTIEGWSHAMDLRDKETEGHSQRVTELTLRLADRMGISESEQMHIKRGALLHDIGKLGVPDNILHKPGPLTEAEWDIMRQHPIFAQEMISPIRYLRSSADIPYCHHEKWDGTGYPRGLKGEQIPIAARMFAIVDVWDALRSDRPYRAAWPEKQTLDYIREQSGTHFDPQIVDEFLNMIANS